MLEQTSGAHTPVHPQCLQSSQQCSTTMQLHHTAPPLSSPQLNFQIQERELEISCNMHMGKKKRKKKVNQTVWKTSKKCLHSGWEKLLHSISKTFFNQILMNQETKQMQKPILLYKSQCLACKMKTNLFKLQDLNVVIEIIECLQILIRKNISQVSEQTAPLNQKQNIINTSFSRLVQRANELFPLCHSVKAEGFPFYRPQAGQRCASSNSAVLPAPRTAGTACPQGRSPSG